MRLVCQMNDSLAFVGASKQNFDVTQNNFVDEQEDSIEGSEGGPLFDGKPTEQVAEEKEAYQLDELRDCFRRLSRNCRLLSSTVLVLEYRA